MSGVSPRVHDFFIVGYPKCGTASLYKTSWQHPGTFMPGLKGQVFLALDLRWRFQRPMMGPLPATLNEYVELALFADVRWDRRIGEALRIALSACVGRDIVTMWDYDDV